MYMYIVCIHAVHVHQLLDVISITSEWAILQYSNSNTGCIVPVVYIGVPDIVPIPMMSTSTIVSSERVGPSMAMPLPMFSLTSA